ncbi:cytosine permease, partial [Acinetobacter baumannii]
HWVGKVASVIGLIAFVIILTQILALSNISELLAVRHFSWSSFLLAVSLSASWQISFGPYVADYSRYLPTKTSSTRVFWAVGLGSLIGSQISMMLGVFIAQVSNGGFVGNEVQYVVGMNPIACLLYTS